VRPTGRLLGTNRPVLHSILQHHCEMKQIFTHPLVSSFHGQQEWSWQGGRKLRQTIKNTSHIWNSKQDISKFYNPSENLASHKVIVLFKVRAIFRQYISKNTKVLALKFINLATQLVMYMTWKVFLKKNSNSCQSNRIVKEDKGPGHKLHMDIVFSSPEPVHVKSLKHDVALCVKKRCFADNPTNTWP